MKKLLPILLLAGFSTAVHAGGLSTRHSTSLQVAIDSGHKEYTRMGASYSISGTNVTTSHTVGTGDDAETCLLYTSPSPRDSCASRMPSSA